MMQRMNSGVSYTALEPDSEERFISLRRALGVTTFGINQIILRPGQRGRIHRHTAQEEVYLVLEGTLTLVFEDEVKELGQGEIARVAPDVRRYIANRHPENVLLIALGGAVEHVGRDGEAFAAGRTPSRPRPQDLPLPPDEPVKSDRARRRRSATGTTLVAGEDDPFGVEDDELTSGATKTHHTVHYEGERPIGHVGLLVAPIQAGGEAFDVVGVGGVIITRSHRGQGLLRPLLGRGAGARPRAGAGAAVVLGGERRDLRAVRLHRDRRAGHGRAARRAARGADPDDVEAAAAPA